MFKIPRNIKDFFNLGSVAGRHYVMNMCGRARLSTDVNEIKVAFGIPLDRPTPNCAANWNVAPTSSLPIVWFDPEDRQRSLDMMRWGLIPHWAKDIKIGYDRAPANMHRMLSGSP